MPLDGNPVDTVLGVPTAEPLANDPQLDVLSLVNITMPEQGVSKVVAVDIEEALRLREEAAA